MCEKTEASDWAALISFACTRSGKSGACGFHPRRRPFLPCQILKSPLVLPRNPSRSRARLCFLETHRGSPPPPEKTLSKIVMKCSSVHFPRVVTTHVSVVYSPSMCCPSLDAFFLAVQGRWRGRGRNRPMNYRESRERGRNPRSEMGGMGNDGSTAPNGRGSQYFE
jgi:hypothetical protein